MTKKNLAVKNPLQIMRNKRVLVVDDDGAYRAQLLKVLDKVGSIAYEAEDNLKAIQTLTQLCLTGEMPDLCLLGLNLETSHGLTFIKQLKSHKIFRSLYIVVHTLPGKESFDKKAEDLKVSGIVNRPIKMSDLVRYLVKILDGHTSKPKEMQKKLQEYQEFKQVDVTKIKAFNLEFAGMPNLKSYALRLAWFRCPFDKTTFSAPRLITRALKPISDDYLALGIYSEAGEKDFLHYELIEQICCPSCLYTSDTNGFHQLIVAGKVSSLSVAEQADSKKWKDVYFSVNPSIEDAMQDLVLERKKIAINASSIGKGLFKINEDDLQYPRSISDALIANRLAIDSYESIVGFTDEEAKARTQQKIAGFLLKRANIFKLGAQNSKNVDSKKLCLKSRYQALKKAMAKLSQINDIELRVLVERLICCSRRFFLADRLCVMAKDKAQKDKLSTKRKQAFMSFKKILIDQRQRYGQGSKEVVTVERYLEPIENRINEIDKQKKAQQNG